MSATGRLAFVVVAAALTGCFHVNYVAQAAVGQTALLARARPLHTVINDPKTDPRTAKLIAHVPLIKRFGEARGLRATQNYERFTQLDRAAAVWVVQGCRPLAFETTRWSFPIVGTVPYLGFFREQDARAYAKHLEETEHLDVDVRGASAYSTLGWFKDPVLSTMLSRGEEALGELADVVLHESTHATVYVKHQSAFDESLASFVGTRLAREWLAARFGEGSVELRAFDLAEQDAAKRIARLHRAYDELEALYASAAPDAEKLEKKAALLDELQRDLGTKRKLNNASLAGFRTYDTGQPAFARLFDACGRQWSCFLSAVRSLDEDDFPSEQMEDFTPVVDALVTRTTSPRREPRRRRQARGRPSPRRE